MAAASNMDAQEEGESPKPMLSGSLGFVALLGALLFCLEEGFEFGHKRNIYGSLPASNFDYPLERKPCMRRMSFRGNQRKFAGGRFLFGLMTGLMRRCGCFLCFARAIATAMEAKGFKPCLWPQFLAEDSRPSGNCISCAGKNCLEKGRLVTACGHIISSRFFSSFFRWQNRSGFGRWKASA